MARNLLIIITYIGAFFLTFIFITFVQEVAPAIPNQRLGIWAQSFLGIAPFILMMIFFRKYIKQQTIAFVKQPGKMVLYGIIGYAVMFGVSIIIGIIFTELGYTGTSENQAGIESLFTTIAQVDLIILSSVIVFFTPVVEEITFRKGVYGLVGYIYMYIAVRVRPDSDHRRGSTSYKIASAFAIIISGLLFGLLHVSNGDYISLIPYGATGIVLGGLYYFTGRNIYPVIFAHVLNNLVGLLVILSI